MGYSFPKEAKLCGAQEIAALYKSGKRFTSWPLRVTFQEIPEEQTRVLVWAPKSLFKRAVKRNHLRRLMLLAFNYMDKEEQPFPVIEKAVQKALRKINGK